MRTSIIAASLVASALLSGCSSGNDDAATRTAERLHASLQAEDGSAACDLLSDDAQEQLAESGDSCESAVMDAGIPDTGRVVAVKVYGTAAQVRYDEDVARVQQVMLDVARQLADDEQFGPLVLEQPEVWGIEADETERAVMTGIYKLYEPALELLRAADLSDVPPEANADLSAEPPR